MLLEARDRACAEARERADVEDGAAAHELPHEAGILIGTLIGAIVGAVVTGMVPGVHPLISGNLLATFAFAAVAGAATGGLAGGLVSMAASGDRALFYEQEVESGRYLVSVAPPGLENARAVLLAAGAMEAAPVEAPLQPGRPRPEA